MSDIIAPAPGLCTILPLDDSLSVVDAYKCVLPADAAGEGAASA